MSLEKDYNKELYHYGVKGMKWGVRKTVQSSTSKSRSYKTDKLEDKITNSKNNKQVQKNMKKYEKAAAKDMKKAAKAGDQEAFRKMASGRTLAKALLDSSYMNNMLTDAAIQAKVQPGKDFAYDILRNEKKGTVDITIGDTTSSYVYAPEAKKR